MVTKQLLNIAVNLLRDFNPEATINELETIAMRGFAMSINPSEYISNLLGI